MREEYRRLTEEHDPDDKEAAATAAALSEVRREACSKETQTWKGIVCSYCTKTFEITNNKIFKDFVEWQTKTAFCVSRFGLYHFKSVVCQMCVNMQKSSRRTG